MGISKGKMGALATMAMMLGGLGGVDGFRYGSKEKRKDKDIDLRPKNPPIPKGCQKYVFKESFGTLEVIAINEKSAMKKYNKWCAENSQAVV
jgi:hypothetical protein